MMRNKFSQLTFALKLATCSVFTVMGVTAMADLPAVAPGQAGASYFFESTQQVPSQVTAVDSTAEISSFIAKDGKQSLKWSFQPGSKLIFTAPFEFKKDEVFPADFLAWIYSTVPESDEKLTFNFYNTDKKLASFQLPLAWKGWYGVNVPYRDIPGFELLENNHIDRIEVVAGNKPGVLYFDSVYSAARVDNRWPIPDLFVPFVNPSSQTEINRNWNATLRYDKQLKDHIGKVDFSEAFQEGVEKEIFSKIDFFNGANPNLEVSEAKYNALVKNFAGFKIIEENGVIKGPALTYLNSAEIVKYGDNFSPEVKEQLLVTNDMRKLGRLVKEAATYLRSNKITAEQRKVLETQVLNTAKYVLAQGFFYGSNFQQIHHLGYQFREYFTGLFLVRDLIAQAGLLPEVQQQMQWFTLVGRIYNQNILSSNVDVLNTQLQWMLQSILLIPNSAQRAELLNQFSSWLSTSINASEGISGGFKSDGTTFHHGQHYVAYGNDAMGGLVPVLYQLAHSPYQIKQDAHQKIHDVLVNLDFFSKGIEIPIALSGRHPTEAIKVRDAAYRWAALAGSPTGAKIDEELAGIYARVSKKAEFEGVKASPEPVGTRAYPWSSMLVHRMADPENPTKSWMFIARGFSRYLPGNEAYGANNLWSRYNLYGKLEYIPAEFAQRPYRHDGFDWNHYDGTTAPVLSFGDLKAKLIQLPKAGVEEMLLSDQTYSGAITLGNNAGMFAQIVHGHAKYNQEGFWANKTYFMFGPRVYAVGSNIQSEGIESEVHTTIVQQFTYDISKPVLVDRLTSVENGTKVITDKELQITLPNGLNYFIPAKSGVNVVRKDQVTPDDRNGKETNGNFTIAYLNHGVGKVSNYDYAITVNQSITSKAPQYKILAQSKDLIAVKDVLTGIEGYAFFTTKAPATGAVVKVEQPALVMTKATADGLEVSVANPDLALYQGVEKDQVTADGKQAEVSVYSRDWFTATAPELTSAYVFKGHYKLEEANPKVTVEYVNGDTKLIVKATAAQQTLVKLVK